jgi:uncharacterized protein YbjT (DUF2867 family)
MASKSKKILLTGATGYVGGRLLRTLEDEGYPLSCLARQSVYLKSRVKDTTEVIEADVLDKSSLDKAFQGIHTAYYLIHSMGSSSGFEEADRQAAVNFSQAALVSGVKKIVYLGGLGDSDENLSPHLKSRQEVGKILRKSGVITIELRASIVLGSGSLSFEMVRSLTEKLPVMITPKWVDVLAQPIGIDDLVFYLKECLNLEFQESMVFEIGGADKLTYKDLMKEYARQRKLKRFMIQVPVLTPRLSSLWLGLVTPVYARVGRKLIDSIYHPTVVKNREAEKYFSIQPKNASESIALAFRNEDREFAETRWSDALSATVSQTDSKMSLRLGSRLLDSRQVFVPCKPEQAFKPISKIGGSNGWYAFNWLWQLRGLIDLLLGGVGMRRGRPGKRELRAGDTLDFWRVEKFESPLYLKLFAEMKLPGKAWLEFEVQALENGSMIRQTAVFYPSGLAGIAYWYMIYPLHALVFKYMLRGIARKAA